MQGIFEPHLSTDSVRSYMREEIVYAALGSCDAAGAKAFGQPDVRNKPIGMTNVSSMVADAILMAYNFVGISSIVDVGGGEGTLLRKILDLNPEMVGAVLDMPVTIETVNQKLNSNTRGGRCASIAGDFFDSVPVGSDAYRLCGVIHDWDDDQAATILRTCRQAMARTGRVLLVDMVLPKNGAKCFSKLLDLNMLVMNGGLERTKAVFLCSARYRRFQTHENRSNYGADFTHWSDVTPFAIVNSREFLPAPPPALTDKEYIRDLAEVQSLGEIDSKTRTQEQTLIGNFWSGKIQDYWNEIAQTAALAHNLNLEQSARLFALVNFGMADAAISFFEAKYVYHFWRPVTAAELTDSDWLPLTTKTAPDPSYPGAHSATSFAAAQALQFYFGDKFTFDVTSEVNFGRGKRRPLTAVIMNHTLADRPDVGR